MNCDDPREEEERRTANYLRRAEQIYGFELVHGVYRPESAQTEPYKQDNSQTYICPIPQPVQVEVSPDWPNRLISIFGLGLSGLTFVLLALTVFYAHQQWVESHRTADASIVSAGASQDAIAQSKDQFRLEQRPYVAETPKSTGSPQFIANMVHPEQGGQIAWDFHYSDFGRTPAYRFSHRSYIKLDGKPFIPSYGEPKSRQEIVLPPGSDVFNTIVSAPMSKEEFDRLMKIDHGIEFRAVFSYQDSYGTWYETGICESHLSLGATQYCEGNYIK